MTMSITLTDQDKTTLRTAAYGAVALLAAAGPAHKIATAGSLALASATGPIGHVLAAKTNDVDLYGKSVAVLADRVFPALKEAVILLQRQDPAAADDFRAIVTVALESAAHAIEGEVSPALADMTRKITAALDAA
jgi:hypothetical protein